VDASLGARGFFAATPFTFLQRLFRLLAQAAGRAPSGPVVGWRASRVRAREAWEGGAPGELSLARGEHVTLCGAGSAAALRALPGLSQPEEAWAGALGGRGELLGCTSRIDELAPAGAASVAGRLGRFPARMVEGVAPARRPNYLEELRRDIARLAADGAEAETRLAQLNPYYFLLKRASEAGAGASTDAVEQAGFRQLYEIREGLSPACSICMNECGYARRPTFMRCVHFACEDCLITWLNYQRAQAQPQGSMRGQDRAACPLCRKEFGLADLIRIVKPAHSEADADKEKARRQGARAAGGAAGGCAASALPRWSPAATDADLQALADPPEWVSGLERELGAYPSITTRLASHLRAACGVPLGARPVQAGAAPLSSKVARLLADLRGVLARGEKAVVFSQHRAAVQHVAAVMRREGLRFCKIVAGDSQAEQEVAVGEFNSCADVGVFLLHAGQAAAGLTLTAASHVMLLEPFLRAGEEAQALNRCHRIGQTREVHATHYYAQGTLEERLEALRLRDAKSGGGDAGGASGGGQTAAVPDGEEALVEDRGGADALAVLDHATGKGAFSRSALARLRFLLGIADEDAPHARR
jgi:hypothetical protein